MTSEENRERAKREIEKTVEACGDLDCRFSRFEGGPWLCLKCLRKIKP